MPVIASLDNFKIWKSTGPMRLAPVTLLLGTIEHAATDERGR